MRHMQWPCYQCLSCLPLGSMPEWPTYCMWLDIWNLWAASGSIRFYRKLRAGNSCWKDVQIDHFSCSRPWQIVKFCCLLFRASPTYIHMYVCMYVLYICMIVCWQPSDSIQHSHWYIHGIHAYMRQRTKFFEHVPYTRQRKWNSQSVLSYLPIWPYPTTLPSHFSS